MKKLAITTLCICLSFVAFAQEINLVQDSPANVIKNGQHLLKYNFLSDPGVGVGGGSLFLQNGLTVGFEQRLSWKWTWEAEGGLMFNYMTSYRGEADPNQDLTRFQVSPTLTLGMRHYYNLDRRLRLGKDVSDFSGNYFAARANVHGFGYSSNAGFQVPYSFEVGYGIQRNLSDELYLDFGVKMQYDPHLRGSHFYPGLFLKLGFK